MGFKLVKINGGSTGATVQANDATIEAVVSNFVAYNSGGTAATFTLYSDGVQILSESVDANGSYRLPDKFNIPATTALTIDTDATVTATISVYVGVLDVPGALTAAQQAAQDADNARILAEAALGTTSNPVITGSITEETYELVGTDIDPANGTVQYKTLTADTTLTDSLSDGQFMILEVTYGGFTLTLPTSTAINTLPDGSNTTDFYMFFKRGTTLYVSYSGGVA